MDDQVEFVSDGEGLAVVGERRAVERFLSSMGLLASSRDLGLSRLGPALRAGEGAARAALEHARQSGRWLKLTPESAKAIKKFGLTESDTPGVSYAIVGKPGSITSWLQVETGPSAFLASPAALAGAAGIMGQLAAQHEMRQIEDYLARIDHKLDDVLRAQDDAQVAKVVGAGLNIEDALTVLERQGRVDDDTWSTVQGRQQTIADSTAWAMLRLGSLAEKVERETKVGPLTKVVAEVESEVAHLLAVLARCFELQDGLDVLRLDRVLDASPKRLDAQRLALSDSRQKRWDRVSEKVRHLMARLDTAATTASSRALLHGAASRAAVGSVNSAGVTVDDFCRPMGIELGWVPVEPVRWRDAVRDPAQLRSAGAEAGRDAALAAATSVAALAGAAFLKRQSDGNGDA